MGRGDVPSKPRHPRQCSMGTTPGVDRTLESRAGRLSLAAVPEQVSKAEHPNGPCSTPTRMTVLKSV
eukprot:12342805-Prorocentrum_lima.AAC.1